MAVADEAATESDPELDFGPGPGLALTGRLGDGRRQRARRAGAQRRAAGRRGRRARRPDHTTAVAGRPVLAVRPRRGAGRLHPGGDARRRAAPPRAGRRSGCPASCKLRHHARRTTTSRTPCVEIVTDDMPFLVDSVTALLTAHHLDVHLLVHPLVVVRREPLGELAEVAAEVEPDDAIDGDLVESWMRVEIDPVRDADAREQLHSELRRVLTDVREAVEDWPKMRQRALVPRRRAGRRPRPDTAAGAGEGHHRLGRAAALAGPRPLHLPRLPRVRAGRGGEQLLTAVLGHRAGHPARRPAPPRELSSMTPEAYRRALEKRLLIITKANSRATVHRSAYLDYIGFKIFDDAGDVVGERRFLGLFSSAAYRTSVRELPVVRRKVAEVLDRSGLSPAQPLRQGPAADPGDLPARRAVPDHDRRPVPRGRSACCGWPAAASCGCSCAATATAGSSPA